MDGQEPMPQLILIDGGPVQLEFAMEALKELEIIGIPIISLAKENEEIYIPDQKEPIRLDHTDPALRLLQHVRDESHRYAITSHRAARGKNFRRSKLEDIPGVGRTKAAQLITKFGSTRAIMDTAEEDLASSTGIGRTLAKRIQEHLRQADEGSPEN
jgi:excinuclease ABC subunit C